MAISASKSKADAKSQADAKSLQQSLLAVHVTKNAEGGDGKIIAVMNRFLGHLQPRAIGAHHTMSRVNHDNQQLLAEMEAIPFFISMLKELFQVFKIQRVGPQQSMDEELLFGRELFQIVQTVFKFLTQMSVENLANSSTIAKEIDFLIGCHVYRDEGGSYGRFFGIPTAFIAEASVNCTNRLLSFCFLSLDTTLVPPKP